MNIFKILILCLLTWLFGDNLLQAAPLMIVRDTTLLPTEKGPDEIVPEFPGGDMALLQYFRSNVRYPEEALLKDIQGVVFVSFVIGADGSVRNVGILKGIGGGCDEEAMRVIASMPNWKPGLQFGKPVAVSFRMPVVFKLEPAVKEKKRKKRHKGTP